MFIAALFIISKNWKTPKCQSVDEWTNKMFYIHTMDDSLAIKVTLPQKNLNYTVLSERSQTQKDAHGAIPFI